MEVEKIKFQTITYEQLRSLPNFQNKRVSATVILGDDENPLIVFQSLEAWVKAQLYNDDDKYNKLVQQIQKLEMTIAQLEQKRQELELSIQGYCATNDLINESKGNSVFKEKSLKTIISQGIIVEGLETNHFEHEDEFHSKDDEPNKKSLEQFACLNHGILNPEENPF